MPITFVAPIVARAAKERRSLGQRNPTDVRPHFVHRKPLCTKSRAPLDIAGCKVASRSSFPLRSYHCSGTLEVILEPRALVRIGDSGVYSQQPGPEKEA